ncbi:hypothetical protein AAU61_03745 [Desulfocarbo indianensis]|nr:hypothetical protein AAU61_03745 [Desulfocarbo indianensis]
MQRRAYPYPEQAAILLIMALLLCLCADWGLPGRQSLALLTHDAPLSGQQKRDLTSQREEFYDRLDASRRAQADNMVSRLAARKGVSLGEWGEVPESEMTPAQKITAFRAYLLGSMASDERGTYRALSRINPAAWDFDPKFYVYGGAYLYPAGALIYLGKLTGLIQVSRDLAWYLDHPEHMARIHLAGRGLNIAAFLGVLVLLALWGRRLGSRALGTLAMLAWALSPLPWWDALASKPHVYAAFWGLGGLFLLDGHARHGRKWRVWLAGAALGMAMGSSLPAAVLALAFPVFLYRPGGAWPWLRLCLAGWLAMLALFFLTNPYAILSHQVYLLTLVEHLFGKGWGYGVFNFNNLRDYFFLLALRDFAFPFMLVALPALIWQAFRPAAPLRRLALLLALLLPVWSLTVSSVGIGAFLTAPLCVLAGWAMRDIFLGKAWAPPALRGALLALCLLPGLVSLPAQVWAAVAAKEPHASLSQQLEAGGLPPEASIGLFEPPDSVRLPPFPFINRRIVIIKNWREEEAPPDLVLVNQRELEHHWPGHPLKPLYEEAGWAGSPPWPDFVKNIVSFLPERTRNHILIFRRKP